MDDNLMANLFGDAHAGRATAAPVATAGKEYAGPGGMTYHSRPIPGITLDDVEFTRAEHAAGRSVLFYGPPGCGKTTVFKTALPDGVVVHGHGEIEVADLLGKWISTGANKYLFQIEKVAYAAKNGLPCLIDEVAQVPAKALVSVYPGMDGQGDLDLPGAPEDIASLTIAPGFVIHGACNPNSIGADLSDALLDRFDVHVEVGMDWTLCAKLGVSSDAVRLGKLMEAEYHAGNVAWVPGIRAMLAFRDLTATYGAEFACNNIISRAPELDRGSVSEFVARTFGFSVSGLKIGS